MKKAIAAGLIVLSALTLTGCYDIVGERAKACIENGGSWKKGAWGEESCTMTNTETGDK